MHQPYGGIAIPYGNTASSYGFPPEVDGLKAFPDGEMTKFCCQAKVSWPYQGPPGNGQLFGGTEI